MDPSLPSSRSAAPTAACLRTSSSSSSRKALPASRSPISGRQKQSALVEVPLERIEHGLRWLAAHPKVATYDGRVRSWACRKGPSSRCSSRHVPRSGGPRRRLHAEQRGLGGHRLQRTPRREASRAGATRAHRFRGSPPRGVVPSFSARGLVGLPIYDRGLENASAVEQATTPVERATGPLLLISAATTHWPASRMCEMVVERMRRHERADAVTHLNYPAAGHSLFPYKAQLLDDPRDPRIAVRSGWQPRSRCRRACGGVAPGCRASRSSASR